MRALSTVLLLACGCGSARTDAQLADLRARLEASERARADAERKLDDVDNRLLLLTDRVESQQVAMGRRGGEPSLPVVTLRPTDEPPPPADEYAVESAPEPAAPAPPVTTIAPKPRKLLKLEGAPPREKATFVSDGKLPSLGVVKLPDKGVPLARTQPAPAPAPSVDGDPASSYRAAYALLMSGKAEEAERAFRDFVKKWPRHDYADNAQYWLGESYYARRDYTSAAPEFQSVVVRWPSGNKAPDALLKLGYCLLSLGETDKGRDVLAQVAEHYPRTDAAHLAEKRLAELPQSARSEVKP